MNLYFESKVVDDLYRAIDRRREVSETSLHFSKLRNDTERVVFAFNLLKKENFFPNFQHITKEKDGKTAADLRNLGNAAFQRKQDEYALKLYNKSMCFAPLTSKEYALAIGNRSAVNLSLRCYNACLKDIQRALKSGYPKNLHFKLHFRKVKCLILQRNYKEASEAQKEAEEYLLNECSEGSREQWSQLSQLEQDLQKLKEGLKEVEDNDDESPEDCLNLILPKCSFSSNKEITCASSCIELKYDKEFGRHIVATKNIDPGDILFVEKPFASVLLPDFYTTHCYYCLQRSFSPVPCSHCSTVIFCDEECRDISWEENHHVDCSLLPTVAKSVGKMGLLALKTLIVATRLETDLRTLSLKTETYEKLNTDPRCVGFDSSSQYVSSNYHTIHSLIGNTELRSNEDLFRRAVTAACLLYCLDTQTCFFQEINNDTCEAISKPDEKLGKKSHYSLEDSNEVDLKFFAGGLILRYLQSVPCNAHEVSEIVFRPSQGEPNATSHDTCEIGAAFYAALSLLNHSCDPNAVRSSYLDWSVSRAIRHINAGEQVLDNYGYHYAVHSLKERRQPLEQQYFFTCKCKACTQNWPLYKDMPNDPAVIVCHCGADLQEINEIVHCDQCGTDTNLTLLKSQMDASMKKYSDILSRAISEPPKRRDVDDMEKVLAHLKLLDRVKRPWRHYGGCQELLKMYFLVHASHCIFS